MTSSELERYFSAYITSAMMQGNVALARFHCAGYAVARDHLLNEAESAARWDLI